MRGLPNGITTTKTTGRAKTSENWIKGHMRELQTTKAAPPTIKDRLEIDNDKH